MTPFAEGLEMGRCSGIQGSQDTGMALGHSQSCLHPSPFPPAAPFFHGIARAQQLHLQCHPSSIILGICSSALSHERGKAERPGADTVPASQPRCSITPSLVERLLITNTAFVSLFVSRQPSGAEIKALRPPRRGSHAGAPGGGGGGGGVRGEGVTRWLRTWG